MAHRHVVTLPEPSLQPSQRWVRVRLGGVTVAESRAPLLLIEYGPGRLPTYFFSPEEVDGSALVDPLEREGRRWWTVTAGGERVRDGAYQELSPAPGLEALARRISFSWSAGLEWLEEEERVFVHARDPTKRVDVLESSRHVVVTIEGDVVADSRRPRLLFETHLPVRYYLPREDVRMDLLRDSELATVCPYKGVARYWSVEAGGRVHADLAWSYEDPIPESPKIKGLVCFLNERVDTVVDGVRQERPITPWS